MNSPLFKKIRFLLIIFGVLDFFLALFINYCSPNTDCLQGSLFFNLTQFIVVFFSSPGRSFADIIIFFFLGTTILICLAYVFQLIYLLAIFHNKRIGYLLGIFSTVAIIALFDLLYISGQNPLYLFFFIPYHLVILTLMIGGLYLFNKK